MKPHSFIRALAALSAGATLSFAQSTSADIVGTVRDSADAVMPNVTIRLLEENTNFSRQTQSNQDGIYEFRILPPGAYTLTVEAAGFKKLTSEHIPLAARQVLRQDIRLEVGAVSESVTVTAFAPPITTETGTIAASRADRLITDGPTGTPIMANFGQFTTVTSLYVRGPGIGALTAAGARAGQWEESVDGNTLEPQFNSPPYSAMSEERETVTGSPAEYRSPVTIDATTKQGTNSPHGAVTFAWTNTALDALGPTAGARRGANVPVHWWNLTGGGPVYLPKLYDGRNRTFWFVSAERNPPSNVSGFQTNTVPTAAMRQGQFQSYFDATGKPGSTVKDPLSGLPFPGNAIPQARWNPVAVNAINKYYPAPNISGLNPDLPYLNANSPSHSVNASSKLFARLDQKISGKNTAGFTFTQWPQYSAFSGTNGTIPYGDNTIYYKGKQFNWQDTHIFSPTVVNEARVSYTMSDSDRFGNDPYTTGDFIDALGIDLGPDATIRRTYKQAPNLYITGFDRIGSVYAQDSRIIRWTQIRDNISIQHGRHTFKAGYDHRFKRDDRLSANANISGQWQFNGFFTGQPFADFLLGLPQTTARYTPSQPLKQRYNEFGAFFQDDFKVNSCLTLNLGMRADRISPRYDLNGGYYNFDLATGALVFPDQNSISLINPAFPASIPRETAGQAGFPSKLMDPVLHWNPRFGFSYRISRAGDTVLRGAFGTFLEDAGWINNNFRLLNTSGPFAIAETFTNMLTNGVPLVTLDHPFPSTIGRTAAFNVSGANPNLGEPTMYQWNLTLERRVYGNWGLRLSYVGAASRHVWYNRDLTRPPASLVPFSAGRRNYPMYNSVSYVDQGGNDNYGSFQASVTHTYSSGLTVMSSFQWINQITDVNGRAWQESTFGTALENPYCRSCEKSKSYLVDPLDFRLNLVYDLPFGHGRKLAASAGRVWNGLIGNWAVAGLVDVKSGRPDTVVFTGKDTSNTNQVGGRADVLPNCDARPGNGKSAPYLNIACFAVPQNGTFGNAGLSPFRDPGMYGVTGTLYKYFPLFRERARLRINAIFANAFNHPVWNTVGNNISQPATFGKLLVNSANPTEYGGSARNIMLQAQVKW